MSSTEPSSGGFNSIRVLVPGTGTRFRCGGLSVALQTARLLSTLRPTEVVTYRERSDGHPYLDDVLQAEQSPGRSLWIVSWGFDVPRSLSRLRGRPVVYQAHSSGYGFALPPGVPVVAVSRNTLGYWGDRAPRNPLFWVPNALEPQWLERGARSSSSDRDTVTERPVDVLVQKRKSSPYVLNQLVPALKAQGWAVKQSRSTGGYYYVHTANGREWSQWEPPVAPERRSSPERAAAALFSDEDDDGSASDSEDEMPVSALLARSPVARRVTL